MLERGKVSETVPFGDSDAVWVIVVEIATALSCASLTAVSEYCGLYGSAPQPVTVSGVDAVTGVEGAL